LVATSLCCNEKRAASAFPRPLASEATKAVSPVSPLLRIEAVRAGARAEITIHDKRAPPNFRLEYVVRPTRLIAVGASGGADQAVPFAGPTIDQAAQDPGLAQRTAERGGLIARAWLFGDFAPSLVTIPRLGCP
jgi:hypothetical protein